jgi:uncharacterized caspase-like protein
MHVPLTILLLLFAAAMQAQPARRALLIGIDDYTASTLPRVAKTPPDRERGWPDLKGSVNDVELLEEMLVLSYGFDRRNIVILKNQQATRATILQAIERHLVRPASKGDVVFYYYAGHGAQVPNPDSDELDRLDESIVPADSRRGAEDIRDKELRPLFNRILDRGAQLTLLLDHCHSGSGFRGMPGGARARGIGPARPVHDATGYGPRPEERGALVLVSAQAPDVAEETYGEDGRSHGAFTWAWIRAMRDAAAGEPAQETFLRAQARLRVDKPHQAPAMLGSPASRLRPFLASRVDRRGHSVVVAIERVEPDGRIVLQGGWAHGLAAGSELRPVGARGPALRVTSMLGLGRSIAHAEGALPPSIRSGALLEVTRWAAPQGRPLRVWVPRAVKDAQQLARRFAAAAKAKWLSDPLGATHLLRPRGSGWELLDRHGSTTPLPHDDAALAAIARLPRQAWLFVQFPTPAGIVADDGVVAVTDPATADLILAGRFHGRRLEYAWLRSGSIASAWTSDVAQLRADLLKLRRIHAWHSLESPAATPAPYRLALRHERTGAVVVNGAVAGDQTYSIVLRATQPHAAPQAPRYYYAFVIDSHGKSYLAWPKSGSVENRFPLGAAPAEIIVGAPSAFRVMEPYGADTYFLLSTEEPLPNPSILEWDGMRAPSWKHPLTPLEELLWLTATGARAGRTLTTSRWSIERITIESVAPARRR